MIKINKNILTQFFIGSIVAIIISIYYFSELRPFNYSGYEEKISRLARFDAELNESIAQTQFGTLKYYDPINKAMNETDLVLNQFREELVQFPNEEIQNKLDILALSIYQKQKLTENFKQFNPVLTNAIYQFSTILAQIIESQASTAVVESCLEQDYKYQVVDKINNLFRGILIYVNFRSEERHTYLVNLVQDIRRAPQQFPKLDLALSYADKILEIQPKISAIDKNLFEVPIVANLNKLNETFDRVFNKYLKLSFAYRVLLYALIFVLLVVLRWAFYRLNGIVVVLNQEIQNKITAEKALEENNRQLEQRVVERTKEITIKNNDLNQALLNLKEAQDQLIIQEKMASVGMLTTGIAHEIKNPLNFVNNFSAISIDLLTELNDEITKNKDKLDPNELKNMSDLINDLKINSEKVKSHGERADHIVKTMLMHSEDTGVDKELVDVSNLMDNSIQVAMENFAASKGKFEIKLEKNYASDLRKILAVPQALSRVFSYIIDNSLYAMKEKQEQNHPGYEPILSIQLEQKQNQVVIKIKDNGTGIPKKHIDKIFEPFFTTKPTGRGNTGLGLSICYDTVVKQHKGELKATSEEGLYTELTITLPISE